MENNADVQKKSRMHCSYCGSEDVLRDAYAEWDYDSQEWVLSAVFDQAYCEGDCGGETSLVEVEEP